MAPCFFTACATARYPGSTLGSYPMGAYSYGQSLGWTVTVSSTTTPAPPFARAS